jgi:hypothetical protein
VSDPIYFIGIATDAAESFGKQAFETCLAWSTDICSRGPHDRSQTPFWQFLDHLTRALLKARYYEASDRYGWSNLLNIGWSEANKWPKPIIDHQRVVAIAALRKEFSQLHDSLVFIASANEYGIARHIVAPDNEWNKDQEKAGIWWIRDKVSGNLSVHGYHPKAARMQNIFEPAVEAAVVLSGALLPRFE